MSFGFEVKSANGVTQLDTTTWGWQFIRAIAIKLYWARSRQHSL